jgi:hypothetical protein
MLEGRRLGRVWRISDALGVGKKFVRGHGRRVVQAL